MLDAPAEQRALDSALSSRERAVLELTSTGLTNAQIGERLGVTVHAVKFHLASIYRKLGVANRTEATSAYLRSRHVGGDSWT
jgi:DNA-binding CsgD family transcriptional regulator